MLLRTGLTLVFLCGALAAHAGTVTTRLFTLQVPDSWNVENDRPGLLLAGGAQMVNERPMPMLSVQYCTNDASPAAHGVAHCPASCDEGAASMITGLSHSHTMQLSPMWLHTDMHGTRTFLMQGQASFGDYAAAFAFVCGVSGQAYMIFAGRSPQNSSEGLDMLLQTLHWWPVVQPPRH